MNYDATFKAKARAREVFDDFLNDLMASPPCTPASTVFRPPNDPIDEYIDQFQRTLRDHSLS